MLAIRLKIVLLFLLLACSPSARAASGPDCPARMQYVWRLDMERGEGAVVEMILNHLPDSAVTLTMPGWTPGSYVYRAYWENVAEVAAFSMRGDTLPIVRLAGHSWRIPVAQGQPIRVRYRVTTLNREFGIGGQGDNFVQINGPSNFMFVNGHAGDSLQLHVQVPPEWRIATALIPGKHPGVYLAGSYDELADAPLELGPFRMQRFNVRNVPFELVFRDGANADPVKFVQSVEKIVRHQIEFFGEIPFKKYVFIFSVSPGFGNIGLEHAASTTIQFAPHVLIGGLPAAEDIIAHEFFHVWNVKRIRPLALDRIDYTRPARTRTLWFCEGVTSYYATLTRLRTGLMSAGAFLRKLEREIDELSSSPDRLQVSVAEASWRIWDTGYNVDGISVYNKGFLLGLLIDLRMRWLTQNRASLDDVLRYLNEHYGKTNRGYPEPAIQQAIEKLSGASFEAFFRGYVYGVRELPLKEYLAYAGILLQRQVHVLPTIGELHLGDEQQVLSIEAAGAAARAGIRRGDTLLRVDGSPVTSQSRLTERIFDKQPGDILTVHVERGGEVFRLRVPVEKQEIADYQLRFAEPVPALQWRIRNGLLQGWRSR